MKHLLFSLMLFLIAFNAPGQYSITNFNSSNSGLENDYVFSVSFDAKGDPWFGLYDVGHEGGIAHYANQSWEMMRMDLPISLINNVIDIVFAPNEDMWVFSYRGTGVGDQVTRWDSTGYSLMTPQGLENARYGIMSQHNLWFADIWSGLYEYNYDSLGWFHYNNFPISLPEFPITAMNVDSTNTFWVALSNRNLWLYKDTVISKIKLFPEYPPEWKAYYAITAIAYDKDGTSWLGTTEGLIHYFGKENFITYSSENSSLPSHVITSVRVDQQGRVWVATLDHGVCIWDGNDFIVYDTSNSIIGSNEVRDMEEDHDGNMWITTWGGGVSKFALNPSAGHEPHNQQNEIQAFPNPININQMLTVQCFSSSELSSFSLYTMEGVKVLEFDLECESKTCFVDHVNAPSGLYLGIVLDAKGNQFNTKIMIVD